MEQKSRKDQEKIEELYDNISISQSFHDRALDNLKKAEREHNSLKKKKDKITYIEEIRKPKQKIGKLAAAGVIMALMITGAAVLVNVNGNEKKAGGLQENPSYDNVTPLPNGDQVKDSEQLPTPIVTPLPKVDKNKEENKDLVNMLHLFVTPPDGFEEVAIQTVTDSKATLAYYNGTDTYIVYQVVETADNDMGTNLILTRSFGMDLASMETDYLMICCVDEEYEQKMDVLRIPLKNMSYKLIREGEALKEIQYIDAADEVRGTFTLNEDQWSMDDAAAVQILSVNVCNAYFSADMNQLKDYVNCDDMIVCDLYILNTMKPYLIKWDSNYLNREDPICVQCQFYGPYDEDSYTYLSLEIQYEGNEFVVKSMALEK